MSKNNSFKLLLCGNNDVGKTSFTNKLRNDRTDTSIKVKTIRYESKKYKL